MIMQYDHKICLRKAVVGFCLSINMPPKKDDKKGGKGGKTKAPPKEIDPALYRRQPLVFEELKDVPNPVNSGFIIDVKSLFPEWDVSAEDWTNAVENEPEFAFPSHIRPAAFKSLKALLVKEVEDATAAAGKGGKKEVPKKGAAPVVAELQEAIRDAAGNILPRMYKNLFISKPFLSSK